MKIEDGYYIVEVLGSREIAERCGDEWWQTGVDYDIWQYRRDGPLEVKVIARIDINALEIKELL